MNCPVLILTPWMSPHQSTTWMEAICLLYLGKAEVLEEYEEKISGPNITMNVPAVMRLKKAINRMKKDVKFSRANVYTRDNYCCQYCGKKKTARELTYDHVIPFSRGGMTVWENIASSCVPCNSRKDNRTPEEAGMHLLRRPYRPKSLPMTSVIALPKQVPDEWLPYLGEQASRKETA